MHKPIILEISTPLDNDFQAGYCDVFRFLIGLSIPKLRGVLCFVFVWGIMGKCELFLFVLKLFCSIRLVYACMVTYMYVEKLNY